MNVGDRKGEINGFMDDDLRATIRALSAYVTNRLRN